MAADLEVQQVEQALVELQEGIIPSPGANVSPYEAANVVEGDSMLRLIRICGAKNGIFECNLPKGHSESHQHVHESGNGGCVGWHNYRRK